MIGRHHHNCFIEIIEKGRLSAFDDWQASKHEEREIPVIVSRTSWQDSSVWRFFEIKDREYGLVHPDGIKNVTVDAFLAF